MTTRHLAHLAPLLILIATTFVGWPSGARAGAGLEGAGGGGSGNTLTIREEGDPNERLLKRYPFRDSSLVWFQSLGAMGLVKSSQLTWNPTYSWLFRLYPRYNFTDKLSLRLKVGLGVEWTNADDTTTYREPRWEDIWVDLVYSPVWTERHTKIELTPSLRLVLPTSKESLAETLVMGIGPGFALKRTFDLPRHMSLQLSYSFRYIKDLNRFTTVQFQGQPLAGCGGMPDNGDCGAGLQSGARAVSHEFINILLADWLVTRKLKLELMVAFFNKLLYGVSTAQLPLSGGETLTLPPDPAMSVSHRASIWYLLEGSYQIHPIVSVGLAVSTLNPQLAEDSTYRAPFINRYTELVLSTTIALDHVVANVERAVRSRRAPRP